MKHTPTPWKVIKNKEEDRYEVYGSDSKDQNACDWIMCDETYYPTAPTIEDAEYIVQCVNSHDELLEACKALIKQLRIQARLAHGAGGDISVHEDNYKVWQQAEEAIQKAEGKS